MKQRIKEIASQVLDELVPETWVALGYDKIKEIQFRTAELIVRECAEMVRIQNEQFMQNESHYGVVSTDVLKHFGVEE